MKFGNMLRSVAALALANPQKTLKVARKVIRVVKRHV
jgi:hypothetical protein